MKSADLPASGANSARVPVLLFATAALWAFALAACADPHAGQFAAGKDHLLLSLRETMEPSAFLP